MFLTATLDCATTHAGQLLLSQILTAAEMVDVLPVPGGPAFDYHQLSHRELRLVKFTMSDNQW